MSQHERANSATTDPIGDLEALADPVQRAKGATELMNKQQVLVNQVAQIRRQAIAELRAQGLSYAQVGRALGVTRGRIAQLGAGPAPDSDDDDEEGHEDLPASVLNAKQTLPKPRLTGPRLPSKRDPALKASGPGFEAP